MHYLSLHDVLDGEDVLAGLPAFLEIRAGATGLIGFT
jgi:hypothetical protein